MQLKERVILRTDNKTDSMCVRVTAKNQTDIDGDLHVVGEFCLLLRHDQS